MPWRQTTNPYYIWLSEVMLQTDKLKQLLTIIIVLFERFPTVEVLSQASEDSVKESTGKQLRIFIVEPEIFIRQLKVHDKYEGIVPKDLINLKR